MSVTNIEVVSEYNSLLGEGADGGESNIGRRGEKKK